MKMVELIRKCLDYATRGIVSLGILASAIACTPTSNKYQDELHQALVTADKNSDGVLQVTEISQLLRELGYKGILMENANVGFLVTDGGNVEVRGEGLWTNISIPKSGLEKYLERNKN